MPGIQLFEIEISDCQSGASMMLAGGRDFTVEADPFYLTVDGLKWVMTMRDATGLAGAAQRIEYRIRRAGECGEAPKADAFFRRRLFDHSDTAVIELSLAAIGELAAVLFEFGAKRITLNLEDAPRLFAALTRFGDDACMVQAAGP